LHFFIFKSGVLGVHQADDHEPLVVRGPQVENRCSN